MRSVMEVMCGTGKNRLTKKKCEYDQDGNEVPAILVRTKNL
jgi:hypothetical protein